MHTATLAMPKKKTSEKRDEKAVKLDTRLADMVRDIVNHRGPEYTIGGYLSDITRDRIERDYLAMMEEKQAEADRIRAAHKGGKRL